MEEARWDYLDKFNALGYFTEKNLAFVIVNINIDYKWPLVAGDILSIETVMDKTGNTSFVFKQTLYNKTQDRDSAIAFVTFVLVDTTINKPIRVTEEAKNLLLGHGLKTV